MRAKGICYITNETEFVNMLKKFSPDGRYIYTFSPEHISYPMFLQIEKLSKDNKISGKDKEISLISARKAAQLIENRLPDAADATERAILEKMRSKALEEANKTPLTTIESAAKRCIFIIEYPFSHISHIVTKTDYALDICSAKRIVKEIIRAGVFEKPYFETHDANIKIFRQELGYNGKDELLFTYNKNGKIIEPDTTRNEMEEENDEHGR